MKPIAFIRWVAGAGLLLAAAGAPAQDTPDDIQRKVRDGMTEVLERDLHGGRTPEEKELLAQAYVNKARQARTPEARTRAFEEADEKYRAWIASLESTARRGSAADTVRLAAGRVAYAGMILSVQAAGELDEYEITAGVRGDRALLVKLLTRAREQYEQADHLVHPLLADLSAHEESLLAAGQYDTLQQTRLDLALNWGWADYYLGVFETDDQRKRGEWFASAERRFQELVNLGQPAPARYLCYLALAMAQRQQGRFAEAERNFREAFSDELDALTAARVRYEYARSQIDEGKFDEAHTTLAPLIRKDPQNLSDTDLPARFYINLAHVWDANAYLIQAEEVRSMVRDGVAGKPVLAKATQLRNTGLSRFNRLARQGGPWPTLVQIYIARSVRLKTPVEELSVIELLYTARVLLDTQRPQEACERLAAARTRGDDDAFVATDVLYELGRCQYRLKNERAAAVAFAELAAEYRSSPRAAQAATFAYQLWGRVAEASQQRDDYLALAATLQNLVENFADHPDREQALWLWPVALQLAGEYEEAAARFAKVPEHSKHWDEAQFQRVMCNLKVTQAARGSLAPGEYAKRARQAANDLLRYAGDRLTQLHLALDRESAARWSAETRLAAGELLVTLEPNDVRAALDAVASFEQQYPDSPLLGRALAIRIQAHRGLREFDQAAAILQHFLETAAPEQIGSTLAALAKGMQEEVERLLADGQRDAARQLASDSVTTFEELEKWVRADASRAANLEFVLAGRAEMHYLAEQYEAAQQIAADLLRKQPRSGNYQRLHAQILTAQLADDAPPGALEQVQAAWATLLADPTIRHRAPERFWEARYNWLAMALRLGNADDVAKAVEQERIWSPPLGGPTWKAKLEALLAQARGQSTAVPATQTATDQAP